MPIDPVQDRSESRAGDEGFVRALSEANCGSGSWESGWTVKQDENGSPVVERDGLTLCVRSGEYRARRGLKLTPGVQVDLRLPKELLGVSPGFYMALGDMAFGKLDPNGLVRIYWKSTPEGARDFLVPSRMTPYLSPFLGACAVETGLAPIVAARFTTFAPDAERRYTRPDSLSHVSRGSRWLRRLSHQSAK